MCFASNASVLDQICSLDYNGDAFSNNSLLLVEPTIPASVVLLLLVTGSPLPFESVLSPISMTIITQTHDERNFWNSHKYIANHAGEWRTLEIQSPLHFSSQCFCRLSLLLPAFARQIVSARMVHASRIQRMRPSQFTNTVRPKMVHFFHCLPP